MADTKRIRILMIEQELTVSELAAEARKKFGRCSQPFMSMLIMGVRRSRRMEKFLAARLGADVVELFPRGSSSQAA